MHTPPLLHAADWYGPALGALAFIAAMSRLSEPTRCRLNAVLVAGASGVYLSGGFGPFELVYPAVVTAVCYRACWPASGASASAYRCIGLAWLLHAAWDLAHHLYGNPIWPFMPPSSFGCLIFDVLIALWFLAGAPSPRFTVAPQQRSASALLAGDHSAA